MFIHVIITTFLANKGAFMTKSHLKPINWSTITDEELLNLRFCDLGLSIAGTSLEPAISQLYQELAQKELLIQPPCYLGDEWFSPDGYLAIAIPFYLAHPRLIQLEKKMMLEVDGGSETSCLKLLRHETGHALCHAYHLTRKKKWQALFGSPKQDFSDYYLYQPYSKRYVRHLDNWYAQSHPEEDFAETFAVWLTPGQDWQRRYQGWPALKKLFYIDDLMNNLKNSPPPNQAYGEPYAVKTSKKKLRTHYDQRRKFYAEDDPAVFDQDLRQLFPAVGSKQTTAVKASKFLRQHKKLLLTIIPRWTHERKFTVNRLIKKLIDRCDALDLKALSTDDQLLTTLASYLTALTSAYSLTGKFKVRP